MCLVLLVLMLGVSSSQAEDIEVSASIKPLHSLVSMVMEGKGEPMLIMGDGASPHSSSLKPSQRRMMAQSEVIFVVHEVMETALSRSLQQSDARIVQIATFRELKFLPRRRDDDFTRAQKVTDHRHGDHDDDDHHDHDKAHSHGEHDDDHHDHDKAHGHDDHDKDDHDDHDKAHSHGEHDDHDEGHSHDDHDKDDHDDHDKAHSHGEHDEDDHNEGHGHDGDESHDHDHHHGPGAIVDFHFWLDPLLAREVLMPIARALGEVYPEDAPAFVANAEKAYAQLGQLHLDIQQKLSPHKKYQFIVFHDAYQYFEKRYDLSVISSILDHHDGQITPSRLIRLRHLVEDHEADCIFAEPQYSLRLVDALASIDKLPVRALDPIGRDIDPGYNLYSILINDLADAVASCQS